MVTPNGIRLRLLTAQNDELVRIIAAMKANPPANLAELVVTCQALQADIRAGLTALDRAAGMIDERSA